MGHHLYPQSHHLSLAFTQVQSRKAAQEHQKPALPKLAINLKLKS